jgi:hypothetical protein
LKKRK